MNTYYQPSGKFSIMSFVWWLLAAAIGMPLLAMIYAYAIWYIPIIYFNLALVLLLGGAVGLLVDYAAIRQGKVRNPMLATVLGGLAGLVALYFQWAVWLDLVVNAGDQIGTDSIGITVSNIKFWQVFSLAINPDVMLELIGKVYDVGTWGIKGSTVSGGFLGLVWLLEAVGVLALSAFLPRLAASIPYDESSD